MDAFYTVAYANITLTLALGALSLHKFRRHDRKVFVALGAAAGIYLACWLLRLNPSSLPGTPWLSGLLEICAVAAILTAAVSEDRELDPRVAIFVSVPVLIFAICLVFAAIVAGSAERIIASITPGACFILSLAGLIGAWYRHIPSPHYMVQSFMFLCVSSASEFVFLVNPEAFLARPVAAAAAAFAFLSLILYEVSLYDEGKRSEPASSEDEDSLLQACNVIAHGMRELDGAADGGNWLSNGLAIMTGALRDILGYGHVSVAMWDGTSNNVTAIGGTPDGSTVSLTPELMSLLTQSGIIISENLREDHRLRGCSFEPLQWNSAAIVPLPGNSIFVSCALVVGDRMDAAPLQQEDHDRLSHLGEPLGVFFSYLLTKGELFTSADVDPVTLRHTYSSFQKTLSHTVDESDKTGGTFALVLFDVDKFYMLNERFGFERGDQVLRGIGDTIFRVSGAEHVARVGPDEFAIILKGNLGEVRGKIEEILSKLRDAATEICPEMKVTLSVAFTMYPFDFLELTSVFGKMREAMVPGSSSMGQLLRVKCN